MKVILEPSRLPDHVQKEMLRQTLIWRSKNHSFEAEPNHLSCAKCGFSEDHDIHQD